MRASERVEIDNGRGQTLAGVLDLPEGPVRAGALFAHCFTCGKDLKAAVAIARRLADAGFATLRFDFTGLGESEGEFARTSFSTNREDLLRAAAWLDREHEPPALLIGHSLGGAGVLSVAADIESCRCVATIGAPADVAHVRHLISGAGFDSDGLAQVTIGGRPFTIGREFVDDLDQHELLERVGDMRRALMVCHSPIDNIVGVENAERIFVAARHPKSFLSLGDADHLLSRRQDAEFVGDVLGAWSARYAMD